MEVYDLEVYDLEVYDSFKSLGINFVCSETILHFGRGETNDSQAPLLRLGKTRIKEYRFTADAYPPKTKTTATPSGPRSADGLFFRQNRKFGLQNGDVV
jgi:hypothetical protein